MLVDEFPRCQRQEPFWPLESQTFAPLPATALSTHLPDIAARIQRQEPPLQVASQAFAPLAVVVAQTIRELSYPRVVQRRDTRRASTQIDPAALAQRAAAASLSSGGWDLRTIVRVQRPVARHRATELGLAQLYGLAVGSPELQQPALYQLQQTRVSASQVDSASWPALPLAKVVGWESGWRTVQSPIEARFPANLDLPVDLIVAVIGVRDPSMPALPQQKVARRAALSVDIGAIRSLIPNAFDPYVPPGIPATQASGPRALPRPELTTASPLVVPGALSTKLQTDQGPSARAQRSVRRGAIETVLPPLSVTVALPPAARTLRQAQVARPRAAADDAAIGSRLPGPISWLNSVQPLRQRVSVRTAPADAGWASLELEPTASWAFDSPRPLRRVDPVRAARSVAPPAPRQTALAPWGFQERAPGQAQDPVRITGIYEISAPLPTPVPTWIFGLPPQRQRDMRAKFPPPVQFRQPAAPAVLGTVAWMTLDAAHRPLGRIFPNDVNPSTFTFLVPAGARPVVRTMKALTDIEIFQGATFEWDFVLEQTITARSGTMVVKTATLTSGIGFVAEDVGRSIVVQGADRDGNDLVTTILSVESSLSVTLSKPAVLGVANATVTITRPADLTGATARMQIRRDFSAATVLLGFTNIDDITLGGSMGTVSVRIPATSTDALPAGPAAYDLEIQYPDGHVGRERYGRALVSGQITRP